MLCGRGEMASATAKIKEDLTAFLNTERNDVSLGLELGRVPPWG